MLLSKNRMLVHSIIQESFVIAFSFIIQECLIKKVLNMANYSHFYSYLSDIARLILLFH